MKSKNKPSIFFFGNQGHGSITLETCLKNNENVIGICTKLNNNRDLLNKCYSYIDRLLRYIRIRSPGGYIYRQPFERYLRPDKLASRSSIPIFSSRDLHSNKLLEFIKESEPDLILCSSFHRLIPERILALAKWKSINLHPGLLPDRGGGTPNRWAVFMGDNKSGVTAHVMTNDFDSGDILIKKQVRVYETDDCGEVEERLVPIMENVTNQILEALHGKIFLNPQSQKGKTNILPPFNRKYRQVNWNKSGIDLQRTCLALRPKSGSIAEINGLKVCIWDITFEKLTDSNYLLGEVVGTSTKNCPRVAIKDGVITINKILMNYKVKSGANLISLGIMKVGDRFKSE